MIANDAVPELDINIAAPVAVYEEMWAISRTFPDVLRRFMPHYLVRWVDERGALRVMGIGWPRFPMGQDFDDTFGRNGPQDQMVIYYDGR